MNPFIYAYAFRSRRDGLMSAEDQAVACMTWATDNIEGEWAGARIEPEWLRMPFRDRIQARLLLEDVRRGDHLVVWRECAVLPYRGYLTSKGVLLHVLDPQTFDEIKHDMQEEKRAMRKRLGLPAFNQHRYGYRICRKNIGTVYQRDWQEAKLIQEIHSRRISGESLWNIYRHIVRRKGKLPEYLPWLNQKNSRSKGVPPIYRKVCAAYKKLLDRGGEL
jgi:hypothetical protein